MKYHALLLIFEKAAEFVTNLRKMTDNNPNLDLVINAHSKFDKMLSISFQDIERKLYSERNSDINQGPLLCYN